MSNNWVKIILDSSHFTAGERVSGEINLFTLLEDTKILIKSEGNEKFSIQKSGGQVQSFTNQVYTLQEDLSDPFSTSQSVFPFTFKIPQYAPASFNYKDTDYEGNILSSEITYKIEAFLIFEGMTLCSDSLIFTVFNKLSRVIIPPFVESTSGLSCCCCISRGSSQVIVESLNNLHVHCQENKKYKILIKSQNNQYLESVIFQLVFDIRVEIPGEKEKFIRKVVNRCVPDLMTTKKGAEGLDVLEFIFDADLKTGLGENPGSNLSVFCSSEYKVQIFTIYNIGCRSKRNEFEVFLQVNPTSSPLKEVEFPPDWNPREKNLKSLLVSSENALVKSF